MGISILFPVFVIPTPSMVSTGPPVRGSVPTGGAGSASRWTTKTPAARPGWTFTGSTAFQSPAVTVTSSRSRRPARAASSAETAIQGPYVIVVSGSGISERIGRIRLRPSKVRKEGARTRTGFPASSAAPAPRRAEAARFPSRKTVLLRQRLLDVPCSRGAGSSRPPRAASPTPRAEGPRSSAGRSLPGAVPEEREGATSPSDKVSCRGGSTGWRRDTTPLLGSTSPHDSREWESGRTRSASRTVSSRNSPIPTVRLAFFRFSLNARRGGREKTGLVRKRNTTPASPLPIRAESSSMSRSVPTAR